MRAERGRQLVEESREIVIVLDHERRSSLRAAEPARRSEEIEEGSSLPDELLRPETRRVPFSVSYEVDGREETLLYLTEPGELAAYEELRAGFTAAVSHELRTPLARILALLETVTLPGFDAEELVEQARAEVEQIRELIDDVLFLSELETGREVVTLGYTPAVPILHEVADENVDRAMRAGVQVEVAGDERIEVPLRPRMLRVVAGNLMQNAIRYAGPGATFRLSVAREGDDVVLTAEDNGSGVAEARSSAPFRALLPHGPRAGLTRNRPRARDRQACRDGRGRYDRGRRCPRRGPHDPLSAPRSVRR